MRKGNMAADPVKTKIAKDIQTAIQMMSFGATVNGVMPENVDAVTVDSTVSDLETLIRVRFTSGSGPRYFRVRISESY